MRMNIAFSNLLIIQGAKFCCAANKVMTPLIRIAMLSLVVGSILQDLFACTREGFFNELEGSNRVTSTAENLESVSVKSKIHCAQACVNHGNCTSYNYNIIDRSCELIPSHLKGGDLSSGEFATGWFLWFQDTNECDAVEKVCGPNSASCTDNPWGYSCTCKTGFELNAYVDCVCSSEVSGFGTCYIFSDPNNQQLSWYDARSTCQSYGGDLVVLPTAARFDALKLARISLVKETLFYWIGAKQQITGFDSWSWIDGSTFDTNMWWTNEPDNINSGISLCMDTGSSDRNMKLHDHDCNQPLNYICEVVVEIV